MIHRETISESLKLIGAFWRWLLRYARAQIENFIFWGRALKLGKMIDIWLLILRIYFFSKLGKKWLSYGRKTYAHIWARAKFSLLLLITLANIIIFEWKFTQLLFFIVATICRSFRLLSLMLLVAVRENFWIWHL